MIGQALTAAAIGDQEGEMGGPLGASRRAGDMVGGCQLIRRLGAHDATYATAGAWSVYLARQPRLGNRLVVVKLMPLRPDPSSLADQHEIASATPSVTTGGLAATLLNQARVLARLAHPNIVALYDAGLDGDDFYLVTQFAPDGSLADALRGSENARWKLDLPAHPRFVVDLVGQVAAALQFMHEHGAAHGNVGASSVLLHRQQDGYWHALLAEPLPATGTEVALWNSPSALGELGLKAVRGGGATPSPVSDQYALAALALRLLADETQVMFAGAQTGGAMAPPSPIVRPSDATMSQAVERCLSRALAADPGARFSSVAAFAATLRIASGFEVHQSTAIRAASTAPQSSTPELVPRQLWLAPERALPWPPRGPRHIARTPPRPHTIARRRHWERGALGLIGIALLIGALVLAIRLPGAGAGLLAANGQPGNATPHQVAIAGGQIAIANGASATGTASMAAAAPPPTEPDLRDAASLVAQLAPVTVAPVQRINVSFTLLNSGTSTWSAASNYGLTCDLAHHPTASCSPGLWIAFGQYVIAPAEQVTFTVDLVAPTDPGSYTLWLNLAHGDRLFTSPDVPLLVLVRLPPQPTASPTATPTTIPTNTPTMTPTDTPTPSPTPTDTPTSTPTVTPTDTPMASPTSGPHDTPTVVPTPVPSQTPPALATPFIALHTSA